MKFGTHISREQREYEDQDEAEDHLLRGEQEKEDPEEEEDDDDDGSDVGSEDSLTSEEEAYANIVPCFRLLPPYVSIPREMTRLMLEEHIDVVMSIIKYVFTRAAKNSLLSQSYLKENDKSDDTNNAK